MLLRSEDLVALFNLEESERLHLRKEAELQLSLHSVDFQPLGDLPWETSHPLEALEQPQVASVDQVLQQLLRHQVQQELVQA